MGENVSLHDLSTLYITMMIVMAFVQPIVGIVSQLAALLIIGRVQKWWKARPTKTNAVSSSRANQSESQS